jgi:hypothetical protein
MNLLAILPDLGPEINAISQEILRSGHTIYPLMGEVTERQFLDACDPSHAFDGLIVNSHGSRDGILLRPEMPGEAAVWLPVRAVVAGIQAAGTIRLLVPSTCEGRALAEEAYWRAGVTTVYSDGDLWRTDAYTLAGTFLRRLATGTLDEALAIADTLGMHWYPVQRHNGQREMLEVLQQMAAMPAGRIERLEERTEKRMKGLEERTKSIEDKLDDLRRNAVLMTPARRWVWLLGTVLFAAPLVTTQALRIVGWEVAWSSFLLVTVVVLALATLLLLYGFGRLPT